MIRLTLPPKPEKLTAELEQALVAEYLATKEFVWHLDWLQKPLLEMTRYKCAYCERKLGEGVNITLDHYVNRSIEPHQVVDWDNLLPCCQSCNSGKGVYNVLTEPFFNPVNTRIQAHLEMTAGGMLKGITQAGKMVIERCHLNDFNAKVKSRFQVIQNINDFLDDCESYVELLNQENTPRQRTKLRNKVRALLNLTQPDSAFSALAATILLAHPDFAVAKQCLEGLNEWTPDLKHMLQIATTNALVLRVHSRPPTN
jgi:HNH endonuclease